ncbi:MAG: hypothetical protein KKA56_11030 [Gammaproteobacteria bacterium]|nr:hypothetical protein [Gammaproteobacteria bacterium]
MKKIILSVLLFVSPTLWADQYYQKQLTLTPILGYEANALGNITTLGLKFGGDAQSMNHVELVTNLSFFTPSSQFRPDTNFTNFETSVRFGVFDQINFYGELGVALDELFVDGIKNDFYFGDDYEHEYEYDYRRDSSRPDWFVGVGGGWRLDWLTVNVYARYRYLESLQEEYLRDNYDRYLVIPDRYQWFTGVELSIRF